MLTTNIFVDGFIFRLPQFRGYDRIRRTPYAEIAAVLLGIAGAVMISPNLATWESSGSRRLWPYKAISALAIILTSSATVPLVTIGLAENVGDITPRQEWQASFRIFLFPYLISTITLVSVALILVSYLGPRIGAIAALVFTTGIWLAQIPALGARLIPLAGPNPPNSPNPYWSFAENMRGRNLPAITVAAVITATAATIIWSRRNPAHRPEESD